MLAFGGVDIIHFNTVVAHSREGEFKTHWEVLLIHQGFPNVNVAPFHGGLKTGGNYRGAPSGHKNLAIIEQVISRFQKINMTHAGVINSMKGEVQLQLTKVKMGFRRVRGCPNCPHQPTFTSKICSQSLIDSIGKSLWRLHL